MVKIEETETTYSCKMIVPVVVPGLSFEHKYLTNLMLNTPDVFSCGVTAKYTEGRTQIGFTSHTMEGMLSCESALITYFHERLPVTCNEYGEEYIKE